MDTGRLGDLIRLERDRRGLSLKQLARQSGVGERYLQDVEAGRRVISDTEARRILKTMGSVPREDTAFTLDDIAATVDLQAAVPRIVRAAREGRRKEEGDGDSSVPADGSIWLDALRHVLRRVPVYNAVMKEVGHRLLPVLEGKIEGAPPEKVFYFMAPDNSMRGFRIHRGDLVLVVPAQAPEDGSIMLLELSTGKALRKVRLMERFQAMLQRYDETFEGEVCPLAELNVLGRCVRLEAELL